MILLAGKQESTYSLKNKSLNSCWTPRGSCGSNSLIPEDVAGQNLGDLCSPFLQTPPTLTVSNSQCPTEGTNELSFLSSEMPHLLSYSFKASWPKFQFMIICNFSSLSAPSKNHFIHRGEEG